MKALITLITLTLMAASAHAGTSQILRQNINPEHLDPSSFRGGVIEMNDDQIKIALFLSPKGDDSTKELVLTGDIYGSSVNDCNETTYFARTQKDSIISVTDRSQQNCDDLILFPIVAEYVTFNDGNEAISEFEGSNFISLSKPTGTLKLGTTLNVNYGTPTIMRVASKAKASTAITVPQDAENPGTPVVLPILYDM